MPEFTMLCGVSYSGKSTYAKKIQDAVILDTDSIIEKYAEKVNKTYSEIFSQIIGLAELSLHQNLKKAIEENRNIVWDQTNLTVSTRLKKLAFIPDKYYKRAVYFPIPSMSILKARQLLRKNKVISWELVNEQVMRYTIPTLEEGFDNIINASKII